MCEVKGGPTYVIDLMGEASNVGFRLDRSTIDFGRVMHSRFEERELVIFNTGKVAFPFKVLLHKVTRTKTIEVHPSTGIVPASEERKKDSNKTRIMVRFRPGLPETIREILVIEAGHFDPVEVPVYGQGVYASVTVMLPRDFSMTPWNRPLTHKPGEVTWPILLSDARQALVTIDPSLHPPREEDIPPPPSASTAVALVPGRTRVSSANQRTPTRQSIHASFGTPSSTPVPVASSSAILASTNVGEGGRSKPLTSQVDSMANRDSRGRTPGGNKGDTGSQGLWSGIGGGNGGPSLFETEIEANRLAYVRHLEDENEASEHAQAQEEANRATNAISSLINDIRGGTRGKEHTATTTPLASAIAPTTASSTGDVIVMGDNQEVALTTENKNGSRAESMVERASSRAGGKSRTAQDVPETHYVIARHVADFGNVVVGFTKKKVFRIVNTGKVGPVSWVFDKNTMAGTGYAIDPEKVVRLPEGASASFTATFQARKGFPHGVRSLELLVRIKHGPPTIIVLKANVTAPEVEVSEEMLDFGDVLVGQSKTKHIQLRNVSPVIAEWDFKRLFGDARDEARFQIQPCGGSLSRNQKVNVKVEFIPTEDRACTVKLGIRLASTSKVVPLVLQGRGVQPRITFYPPLVELGPVLPHSEDGDQMEVEMRNESVWDIEVFSLDFDKAYLQEEAILVERGGFASDGTLRLPPRKPGSGLHHSLLQQAVNSQKGEERLDRQNSEGSTYPFSETFTVSGSDNEIRARVISTGTDMDATGDQGLAKAGAFGEEDNEWEHDRDPYGDDPWLEQEIIDPTPEWDREPTPREMGKEHDLIVIGPILSGKSTLAQHMADRYQTIRLTVGMALAKAVKQRNALGARIRAALHKFSSNEESCWANEVIAAQEQAAIEAKEHTLGVPGTKNKKSPLPTHPTYKGSPPIVEHKTGEAEVSLHSLLAPEQLSVDLLVDVLRWRLSQHDCSHGVVLDDITAGQGLTKGEVAQAVARAMPRSRLIIVTFPDGHEGYITHLRHIRGQAEHTKTQFANDFADLSSPEEFGCTESTVMESVKWGSSKEGRGQIDGVEGEKEENEVSNMESANGEEEVNKINPEEIVEGKDQIDAVPHPQPVALEEPTWDLEGDHTSMPPWRELSETEIWGLDDRQQQEHYQQEESRNRILYDRACRLTSRASYSRTYVCTSARHSSTHSVHPYQVAFPSIKLTCTNYREKGRSSSETINGKAGDDSNSGEDINPDASNTAVDSYTQFCNDLELDVVSAFSSSRGQDEEGHEEMDSSDEQVDNSNVGKDDIETSSGNEVPAQTIHHSIHDSFTSSHTSPATGTHENSPAWKGQAENIAIPDSLGPRVIKVGLGILEGAEDHFRRALELIPGPVTPLLEPGELPIPADKVRQVIRRPSPRGQRTPLARVDIQSVQSGSQSTPTGRDVKLKEEETQCQWSKQSSGEKGIILGVQEGNPYRWVIRARESVQIIVKFSSSTVGQYDVPLAFETVGTGRQHTLHIRGDCTFPSINSDPRSVFMRRIKHRPEGAVPPVSKRFVMSRGTYEFGPLLTWKVPGHRRVHAPKPLSEEALSSATEKTLERIRAEEEAHRALVKINAEIFRISNNGRFPAHVMLAFDKSQTTSLDCGAGESVSSNSDGDHLSPPSNKVQRHNDDNYSNLKSMHHFEIFYVEPESLNLAVGETGELRVWAFPPEAKTYRDTLIACVSDNPHPVLFPISCSGAVPRVNLDGPWKEELALERALLEELNEVFLDSNSSSPPNKEQDPRLTVAEARVQELEEACPLLDFDRLLLGRTESREFYLRNVCGVACAWRLDTTEVDGMDEFRMMPSPPEGVLEVGGVARVTVMFSAIKEGIFQPRLGLEYCDTEVGFGPGGESRVQREEVKVISESYRIHAVAFETEEEALAAEAESTNEIADVGTAGRRGEKQKVLVSEDGVGIGRGGIGQARKTRSRKNDGSLEFGRCKVGDSREERFSLRNRSV
ncbi:unnamed protein product [Choristocarpus tenellus]